MIHPPKRVIIRLNQKLHLPIDISVASGSNKVNRCVEFATQCVTSVVSFGAIAGENVNGLVVGTTKATGVGRLNLGAVSVRARVE